MLSNSYLLNLRAIESSWSKQGTMDYGETLSWNSDGLIASHYEKEEQWKKCYYEAT